REKQGMKRKILQEAMEWYNSKQSSDTEVDLEEFIDVIIDKTADSVLDKVKDELINEFENGNLQHPFIISSNYYLDLKLKDIKNHCTKFPNESLEKEKK
ncbi:MAG: hypothetical protein V5A64_06810, partial [Candidatus Thermoplasmatota archaeon]